MKSLYMFFPAIALSLGLTGDAGSAVELGSIVELARTQPENPACPYCDVDTGGSVSIQIDPSYAGEIFDVELTTYDAARQASTFHFDQAVIDSINDPSVPTLVDVSATNIVVASLTFTLHSGEQVISGLTVI